MADLKFTYTPTLPAAVCSPTLLTPISFSLYGGVQFDLRMLPKIEDGLTVIGRSLQDLGLSAGALAPLIKSLAVLKALIDLVKVVATLDVLQIPSALAAFGTAIGNFAQFVIFPVQLLGMVRGFLETLKAFFLALQAQITQLVTAYTNVNAAIAKAQQLGNAAMLANAQCAKERLDAKVAQLNASLATLGAVIAVFTILICIVGGGEVSLVVPTLNAASLSAAVFDPIIAAIQAILDVLPEAGGVLPLEC